MRFSIARPLSALLDALAPPTCAACDAPSSAAFCDDCRERIQPTAARLVDGVPLLTLGRYAPPLSAAIVRLKYEGRADLARGLGQLLTHRLESLDLPPSTVFAPVPLHPRRLASRGYNQAALIARELSRAKRLPYAPRLLARTRDTEAQVGQARAARLTNASGAFALRKAGPGRAVLVDDVFTTGATVRACAETLALGGIELVAVVALAEAMPAAS
jgi:ComF family protein